jgi:hypothetical protein
MSSVESSPGPESAPGSVVGLHPPLAIRTHGTPGAASPAGAYASLATSVSPARTNPSPSRPPLRGPAIVTPVSATPVALPYGISLAEAHAVLDDFRANFMPRFPFVVVPPEATPLDMVATQPFLLRSIVMAAAPFPPARVRKMVRSGRAYLCTRMIVNGDRNLDLLQGLLVSIAW